jgi:hypothetical protein
MQHRQQQRARAQPQIEDTLGVGAGRQSSLHQHLAVAARDQHIGGDGKLQPEKFLATGDIGNRFMAQTALDPAPRSLPAPHCAHG